MLRKHYMSLVGCILLAVFLFAGGVVLLAVALWLLNRGEWL